VNLTPFLQKQTNGGSWSTAYSGSGRSKAESGQGNGRYGYRVRACNAGGCGAWSGTKTVIVTHPPASAPSLSVPSVDNNGSYKVSWGAVSTATSYTLQERKGSGSWATAYNGASRSKSVSGKADGTYGYRVRACTVGGCGPWSTTKTVQVARPPASAPSLSAPSSNHSGSYTVKWGSVSRATSYTLQERKGSGRWSTIYNSSGRSKARSGRTDGSYGYRVRACNAGGCGAWSATHTVHVTVIPGVPTGVYIYDHGNRKFIRQDLAWDAVSHATHYDVKVGTSPTIINVGTATSYQLGGYFMPPPVPLPTVTGYVRACNANGCSAWVKGSGT
jgi:predicted phage tail protein